MSIPGNAGDFDTVILNGRVIDPETGLDEVRNVGIRDGLIVEITNDAIEGGNTLDAAGHVVTAGFIDTHFHWSRPMGYKLGLRDGLTTSMDLEFGTLGPQVDAWYLERRGTTQVNYGTASSHELARSAVLDGVEARDAPTAHKTRGAGTGWAETVPTTGQLEQVLSRLDEGLQAGAIGIGSTLGYMPGVSANEMFRVQQLAGGYGRQTSVHLRHTPGTATSEVNGAQEILANAVALGAPACINHFNNPGWEQTADLLQRLRKAGYNVWGEIYPYAAGSTTINAVFLRPETWVHKLGRRYEDTMLDPATNEFHTEQTYARTVAENPTAIVILYKMPVDLVPEWLRLPGVTMGSDGMPIAGAWPWPTEYSALPNTHPRGAGSRGKSLRLAREHDIPLMQVLAQLSYNSAKYLGDMGLQSMQRRGRMQTGMVADIVIFDPERVTDNATYMQGNLPTTGIPWVLVNGEVTVADGEVLANVHAGQPIRFSN
jgi:cytosine/adenosine deaminase-related metal-dependent hydrolase